MSEMIDVVVLDGLPCTVGYNVYEPEPDVGIFRAQIDVVDVYDRHGRRADWIAVRLSPEDYERIEEQIASELGLA